MGLLLPFIAGTPKHKTKNTGEAVQRHDTSIQVGTAHTKGHHRLPTAYQTSTRPEAQHVETS
jgi:hypothetical protein